MLCYTILYYTIIFYTILSYTILYDTIRYDTTTYCSTLCYDIRTRGVARGAHGATAALECQTAAA